MLDEIDIVRFERVMTSGRTQPLLLTCRHPERGLIDVVAKLCGQQCSLGGLIREACAAMLAADLGLPVAEPFLVRIDDEFCEDLKSEYPEVSERLKRAAPYAYGSLLYKPVSAVLPGSPLSSTQKALAAEVYAFDLLTRNPDRHVGNPNLLRLNRDLVMIDHELSLLPVMSMMLDPPPWVIGSCNSFVVGPKKHVFAEALRRERGCDFTRLMKAWERILPARYVEYVSALPPEWIGYEGVGQGLSEYLSELHGNLTSAFAEVVRTLS